MRFVLCIIFLTMNKVYPLFEKDIFLFDGNDFVPSSNTFSKIFSFSSSKKSYIEDNNPIEGSEEYVTTNNPEEEMTASQGSQEELVEESYEDQSENTEESNEDEGEEIGQEESSEGEDEEAEQEESNEGEGEEVEQEESNENEAEENNALYTDEEELRAEREKFLSEVEKAKKEKAKEAKKNRAKKLKQKAKERKILKRQTPKLPEHENKPEEKGFSFSNLIGGIMGKVKKTLRSPSSSELTSNVKNSLLTGLETVTGNKYPRDSEVIGSNIFPKLKSHKKNLKNTPNHKVTKNVLKYMDKLRLIDINRLKMLRARSLGICLNCYNNSEYASESEKAILKALEDKEFYQNQKKLKKNKKTHKKTVSNTINYLKNLGVIDEIKIAELKNIKKAKKLGVCIRCFKRRAGEYKDDTSKGLRGRGDLGSSSTAASVSKPFLSAVVGKVLDKNGKVVNKLSLFDMDAPFGYIMGKDGKLRKALSNEDAQKAVELQVSSNLFSGEMVLDKDGNLVPKSVYSKDPSAPFGYIKDPNTNIIRAASSSVEAKQSVLRELQIQSLAGNFVLDQTGNLVLKDSYSPLDEDEKYGFIMDDVGEFVYADNEVQAKYAAIKIVESKINKAKLSLNNIIVKNDGNIVEYSEYKDDSAPFGYVREKDKLRPSTSIIEGFQSGNAEAIRKAGTIEMVLDASCNLVSINNFFSTSSPYGYAKNESMAIKTPVRDKAKESAIQIANVKFNSAQKKLKNFLIDSQGNLIPALLYESIIAPNGYIFVKAPASRSLKKAASYSEGILAAQEEITFQANYGNIVQDASGNLVPRTYYFGLNAPHGYIRNSDGTISIAKSAYAAINSNKALAATQAKAVASEAQKMVLDANGNLVPLGTFSDPSAPYGYVKNPDGTLSPAVSETEAFIAANNEAVRQAETGNMVLDKNGNLVSKDSLNDPNAPYGYVKDENGNMIPAISLQEAQKASSAAAEASQQAAQKSASNMVLDVNGNLVPQSSLSDTNAPYGYIKDANGNTVPASSEIAALQAAKREAVAQAASGNMVLDKNGNLVPASSFNDPSAPYGYMKDTNGNIVPATSLEQAKAAATQIATAQNEAFKDQAGDLVLDANGNLVPKATFSNPSAPYGYVRAADGSLVAAKSANEAAEAANAEAITQAALGNMVLDKNGNLVPKGSFSDLSAPYGYVKDTNGNFVAAKSLDEARNAASNSAKSSSEVLKASSGDYVLDKNGKLVAKSEYNDPNAPYGYIKDVSGNVIAAASKEEGLKAASSIVAALTAAGETVVDKNGNIVLKIQYNDPSAPYGYVKDANGKLVAAKSPDEAKSSSQFEAAAKAGQYVLNSKGDLVPASSLNDPSAPYGYIKNADGTYSPASSAAEAIKSANQESISKAASGEMVLNSKGILVMKDQLNDPAAPYGYIRGENGNIIAAKSASEAQQSALSEAAANSSLTEPEKVVDKNGNLVLKSEYSDSSAPYGYMKDANGNLVAAKSPEEALSYANAQALQNAIASNMVLDKNGNLVPYGTLNDSSAPYGYMKDANGKLVAAKNLAESIALANQIAAKEAIADLLVNNTGNLVSAITFTGTETPYGYLKEDESNKEYTPAETLADGIAYAQKVGASVLLLDSSGNLATLSKMFNTSTPNGNVKGLKGYIAAKTLTEGILAAKLKESGTLVLDKNGDLTPLSLLNDSNAPYGYVKNSDGTITAAATLEKGVASGKSATTKSGILATLGNKLFGSGFSSFVEAVQSGNVLGAVCNVFSSTPTLSENFMSVTSDISSVKDAAKSIRTRASLTKASSLGKNKLSASASAGTGKDISGNSKTTADGSSLNTSKTSSNSSGKGKDSKGSKAEAGEGKKRRARS